MKTPEVRDIEERVSFWSGYRDELIATAMTLSLLVLGTFLVTERVLRPKRPVATPVVVQPTPQTLGVQDVGPTPSPSLTPYQLASLQSVMATEGARVYTEVPYGDDGYVEFVGYVVTFKNPRIAFDKTTNLKRQLLVDLMVENRSVTEGIDVRLTASIIKDGKIIVQDAALSMPDSRALAVGETLKTTASLGLIDGTDVRELKFKPGHDLPIASHFLNP